MKSIMKTYAMQIYSKISPFLEKDERELKPVQGDRTLQDVEVLDTVKPTKEQDAPFVSSCQCHDSGLHRLPLALPDIYEPSEKARHQFHP